MKVKEVIKRTGWGSIFLIIILISIFIYERYEKSALIRNAEYVKGISLGVNSGARGHLYLDYIFSINGKNYKGSIPSSFCQECKNCCNVGDTVIVRYDSYNPANNDLVKELPLNTNTTK